MPAVNGLPVSVLVSCRGLKAHLPDRLGSADRREAQPVSDTTAAWGDPPVTLRCGVPAGSGRDDPYTINAVQWAMHDTGASRTWTTVGRRVNIALEIPDAYRGQAELVGSVAFVVAKQLR